MNLAREDKSEITEEKLLYQKAQQAFARLSEALHDYFVPHQQIAA